MKLSLKEKIGYGLGDTASHFVFDMVGFWILIFYTDTFGISAAAAGTKATRPSNTFVSLGMPIRILCPLTMV